MTLEANPDDLTPAYINMLRKLPFNRLSMGIQTFDDRTLKLLNRRHTAQQAIEAFENCRKAGFKNISIDLMYGLPGETTESWERDLQQAVRLNPEHISAYHLIYEEGTPLWTLREQHRVAEADEDLSLNLFTQLIHRLKENGYVHYEYQISACRDSIPNIIQVIGQGKSIWDVEHLHILTTVRRVNGMLLR